MIWGPLWANNRVVVHCDNQAAICVVNAGYSRNKDMMHLMPCLFFIRTYWGIDLWAVHIPGEQKVAANAISRGCTDQFKESLDYLDSVLTQIGSDHDTLILGNLNADTGLSAYPDWL